MEVNKSFGEVTNPGTLRLKRVLPAAIDIIWEYLVDSEKRGKWLASGDMDLRIGGLIELYFNHAGLTSETEKTPQEHKDEECAEVRGHITRIAPPNLLSYTWEWGGELTEVTFELTPSGEETELILTHRLISKHGQMISIASGWHTHLAIMIDKLNGKEPEPFWKAHAKLEKEYESLIKGD